jgi:hypothetical protein
MSLARAARRVALYARVRAALNDALALVVVH